MKTRNPVAKHLLLTLCFIASTVHAVPWRGFDPSDFPEEETEETAEEVREEIWHRCMDATDNAELCDWIVYEI